ncbi:MAG: hypothetical protein AAGK98_04520 [Pseudomonadota bacterium]
MSVREPGPTGKPSLKQQIWLGLRIVMMLGLLVILIIGLEMLIDRMEITDWLRAQLEAPWRIALVLVVYALVIAVPFAPGVEIGVAVMVLLGQTGAVVAYVATIAGLFIAFAAGRLLSDGALRPLEDALGMSINRPGASEGERLEALFGSSPIVRRLISSRYLAIMVMLNLPGNVVIGGGGGIMMLAGFSRAFAPGWLALAVAGAVLPIPLLVYIFGAAILG